MAAKKKKKSNPALFVAPLIALVIGLALWYAHVAFEDRHWKEYREAGQRASARGNYEYAERMHRKALKEAEDLGPQSPLIVQSLADLSKIYKAQGKSDQATSALARARALRSGSKK